MICYLTNLSVSNKEWWWWWWWWFKTAVLC